VDEDEDDDEDEAEAEGGSVSCCGLLHTDFVCSRGACLCSRMRETTRGGCAIEILTYLWQNGHPLVLQAEDDAVVGIPHFWLTALQGLCHERVRVCVFACLRVCVFACLRVRARVKTCDKLCGTVHFSVSC
jgi:hypothetical protein